MYLAKSFRKRVTKKTPWVYYFLRDTVWDSKAKKRRNVYRAYIGTSKTISLAKAQALARKLKISVDALRAVRGLKILSERDTPC